MLEDLIRENVLRQQKARKNSLEKSTKKNKEYLQLNKNYLI